MSLSDELIDPGSDIVRQAALNRRCKLCHQVSGNRCSNPINDQPLADRDSFTT